MADPELIKEVMVDLGEGLDALGFDGPLEVIEGNGLVGKAIKNCRYDQDRKIVFLYLKDLAKTLVGQQPTPEVMKARQLVNTAWLEFKEACSDHLEPTQQQKEAARAAALQQQQRAMASQQQKALAPKKPQLPPRR
jgi:hypothetical protein